MLQIRNDTPFAAALQLMPDREGIDTVYAVVKGTFALGPGVNPPVAIAEQQVPVAMADRFYGEPANSSVRVPSDVCLGKPATDVVMAGSAWAPGGRPTTWMDVALTVGPVSTTVRVIGDRVWESGAGGMAPSAPTPFERLPLVWERAFGGVDITDKGPAIDRRNPAGVGFRASGSVSAMAGRPVPNLNDPSAPVASPRDAPNPVGFAPIAAHWLPRAAYAGTYDAAWERDRAPYLPADFDARYFQLAPPRLVAPGYLSGGEWVDARGVTPDGVLQFQLPALRLTASFQLAGRGENREALLDTVLLEPDAGRVILVWRSALRCDKQALKLREARITMSA